MKLMKMFNQDMGYGPDAKVLKPQKADQRDYF